MAQPSGEPEVKLTITQLKLAGKYSLRVLVKKLMTKLLRNTVRGGYYRRSTSPTRHDYIVETGQDVLQDRQNIFTRKTS